MAKILLVEDDPMIAEIYIKKFRSSGFDVINAKTGKETLKYLKGEKFDLTLLDLVIPEISGMDVLKEVKKGGGYSKDIKIVVFSNLSQPETREEALENGADGFISKSDFTPKEIVEKVSHLINEFSEINKNRSNLGNEKENEKIISGGDKKKILLIEDEDVFIEMFGKKLEDDGYLLTYAKNGTWGLEQAIKNNYDLVITDYTLPLMTGEDILVELKKNTKTKNIPVIVLSASVENEASKKLLDMGAADFIMKTHIVPSDLSRKIAEILKISK